MAIIDSINQEYVDLIKQMDSFHTFNTKINEIQNAEEKPADKIRQSVQHLKSLRGSVDASQLEKLDSIISLCESYLECVDSIIDYKIKLVNYDGKNQTPVLSASERVIAAQKRFELVNKRFSERYEDKADTDKSINKIISTCTGNAMSFIRGKMDELRKKASDIMQEQATVELKLTDSLKQIDYLPNTFLVARSVVQKATKQVLKDIGANDSYEDIFINLRNGGNIVVHANHEQMRDQKIDDFIISYLFRFIESFPAGNVNVHVFDQNPNYIYMRLCNSFQTENASENTKKTVQIHSSVSDLSSFRVVCDDIFKKTSTENPDLYSIYEHDKTDHFNLVIIRGGLVDGSGVAPSEFLDLLNSLSKPGDYGHKCGFRFLIIDNSRSFEKNLTPNSKHLIECINQNCELDISYDGSIFTQNSRQVEVLTVLGKKTWTEMAERGGVCLLLAQMRALANAAAKKAVENAGKKTLENSLFRSIFEQIGKKLSKEALGKFAPVVGGLIGGFFDTAQMSKIIDYADIFYHKRFIIEKQVRVNTLVFGDDDDVIDVNPGELKPV